MALLQSASPDLGPRMVLRGSNATYLFVLGLTRKPILLELKSGRIGSSGRSKVPPAAIIAQYPRGGAGISDR